MNIKRILASILCIAMVLSTMGTVAFAADEEVTLPAVDVAVGGDDGYATWSAAINNATDVNADGIITYGISGKVIVDEYSIKGAVATINIIGMTDDAELSSETANPTDNGVVYINNNTIETVNFSNLKLSRPNGEWRGNEGHHNRFFTVWDSNGSTDLISYTNCVFPNGAGNNQYGKTTYTECTFNNDVYYALWIYGSGDKGVVEVTGGTFNADRGVKIYSEDASAVVSTTITESTFDIASKPAIVSSIAGELVVEGVDASACEYGLLASEPKDGRSDLEFAEITVDGEEPVFVAQVGNMVCTDMAYAEAEKTDEKPIETPAAKVGTKYYASLQKAIDAAEENDTITILAGEYNGFNVPTTLNNVTFVGETDADGNNLVTIKTLEDGIESHNGGIFVQAETTTFKNLNFTAGTVKGVKSGWMSSSLGNTNGDTGMRSSLKNLTVENCNFVGSGVQYAIWTNQGNVTVKNSTITNYDTAVDTYGIGADQKMVIENTEIADVRNAFHTGEAVDGSQIVVTKTDIDSDVIDFGGAVAVNVTESTIKNAKVTTYASSTLNILESALYDTTYAVYEGATGSITLNSNYVNNVNEVAENAKVDNITFNTYYQEVSDLGTGNTVTVPATTDAIYVKFENITDANAEGEKLYNINLVATDDEIINRLNSADLTFDFNAVEGDVAYEIIASNSEVVINPVNNSDVRYEFHYNGKDNVTTDSNNTITIGQVRFEGYGKFNFTVDATVDTNIVHATTVADNIVDTFIPNGDSTTVANGELVINDDTIKGVEITVPTRNLEINVDFPNSVENQNIGYQQMTITITGEDLPEAIVATLGNNGAVTIPELDSKENYAGTVTFDESKYTVTLNNTLTLNTSYNVEVSGEGYRTARYTVTMTEDKTLDFWNNVKDAKKVIEIGTEADVDLIGKNVTFLAGDIVKDNNINVYDLSAVVSYFGEIKLVESNKTTYAKYDLNRDGKIDSKDVAMVLVSWGK